MLFSFYKDKDIKILLMKFWSLGYYRYLLIKPRVLTGSIHYPFIVFQLCLCKRSGKRT